MSGARWWRTTAVLVVVLSAAGLAWGSTGYDKAHNARVPLLSAVVGIGPGGRRQVITGLSVALQSGTRVLAVPGARVEAAGQAAWLAAGTVPAADGPYADMVRKALLDLDTLLLPNGAAVAAWPAGWRYVWPRDAAFAAVALARTGHPDDAVRILEFLQTVQAEAGVFQARYLPDGSGVPDARGEECDGAGWAMWATWQLTRTTSAGAEHTRVLHRLARLITRSTRQLLAATNRPDGLPDPCLDYWEVPDGRLSLGTAAPIALGLHAAGALALAAGQTGRAESLSRRSDLVYQSIRRRFGADRYPHYLGGDASDASVAFLLPPFTDPTDPIDPAVKNAWMRAENQMRRPAGGLAPGADWKEDGISWTPETALFALTAASSGERDTANRLMTWLTAHRTSYGALSEKVLSNGDPAGPAPLAWSDALVILTAQALD